MKKTKESKESIVMNKIITTLVGLLLCVSLCACSNSDIASTNESTQTNKQPEQVNYILRLIEYNSNGCITSDTSFTLDSNGHTKEEIRTEYYYNEHGLLSNSIVFYEGEQVGKEYERFEYDNSGRILNKFCYGELTHEFQYNEAGQCVKERIIDSDGVSTFTYTYQNGIISTSYKVIATSIDTDDGSVSVCNYYLSEYDSQGRITKETAYEAQESPSVTIYQYLDNETVIDSYDLVGNLIETITMRFDDNNRLIYKNHLHSISDYNWTNQYEYTDNSQKMFHYGNDGMLKYSHYYVWDNQNNLLLEENLDGSGNVTSSWQYEYDDNYQVSRLIQTIGNQESIVYGPDRKYYEDGTIKSIIVYANIDYIAEIYFASNPKGYAK